MKKQILLIGTIIILLTVGFSGCFEENSDSRDNSNDQNSEEVILTTDKNEYISGEKLLLTFVNNKNHSIFNQGGPLSHPSPIKSFDYGLQKFINGSWREFQLVRGEKWKHVGDPVIQVVVDCIEYSPNSTNLETISLTCFVYEDNGDYYENIPPGQYRIVKSFYNECNDDFSTIWSEPFTVYSNEFTILEKIENISSIGYLVNHSDEFFNKIICIKGTVTMGPPVCTAMMCPLDDPCCNACSAQLMLYDNTSMIKVSGSCSNSGCDWICSPLELHKTYKVTGNWTNDILEIISYELLYS